MIANLFLLCPQAGRASTFFLDKKTREKNQGCEQNTKFQDVTLKNFETHPAEKAGLKQQTFFNRYSS